MFYTSNNDSNFTHAVKLKNLVPGLANLLLLASESANSNKYCRIFSVLLVKFQNHIVRYYYSIHHIFEPYNTEKLHGTDLDVSFLFVVFIELEGPMNAPRR